MSESTSVQYKIRLIEPKDNSEIAAVIKTVMPEFGAVGDGFSIMDPEIDAMFEAYQNPRHCYFVIEDGSQRVIAGSGVAPLTGAEPTIAELRKMYILKEHRGHGLGRALMMRCLNFARDQKFESIYLESLKCMEDAMALYLRFGFQFLDEPMGDTGHGSCDVYMLSEL